MEGKSPTEMKRWVVMNGSVPSWRPFVVLQHWKPSQCNWYRRYLQERKEKKNKQKKTNMTWERHTHEKGNSIYIYILLTKRVVKMAGYWPSSSRSIKGSLSKHDVDDSENLILKCNFPFLQSFFNYSKSLRLQNVFKLSWN